MSKIEWRPDKDGEAFNSACGRYRIVRLDDWFGEGSYYKLCWLGEYGQTCCREYGTLGDARRAAAMRAIATEICV